MAIDDATFDRAIDEWAQCGTLPKSVRQDVECVFKIIDFIPQFVQPLTKSRFNNVANHIVNLVAAEQEFCDELIARLSSPDKIKQRSAAWLCCLLVAKSPVLEKTLANCKRVYKAGNTKKHEPKVFEIIDLNQLRFVVVMLYATEWPDYIALLKSSDPETGKFTAAALYSEVCIKPELLRTHLSMNLVEPAFRVFERLSGYPPFLVSWIGRMNSLGDKKILRWEQTKSILKRAKPSLESGDPRTSRAALQSLYDLSHDIHYNSKKSMFDKMVDYDLHYKIIDYLSDSTDKQVQLEAVKLIAKISETRAEELECRSTHRHLQPLLYSDNPDIQKYARIADRHILAIR